MQDGFPSTLPTHIIEKAKAIRYLISDVDGVLTDGALYLGHEQHEIKRFHVHDGLAIRLCLELGVTPMFISARQCSIVEKRLRNLGVKEIIMGRKDKLNCYQQLKQDYAFADNEVAYIGDDLVDLPVMQQVGLSVAVANANPLLQSYANWQTRLAGGHGAIRELSDLILIAQGKQQALLNLFADAS